MSFNVSFNPNAPKVSELTAEPLQMIVNDLEKILNSSDYETDKESLLLNGSYSSLGDFFKDYKDIKSFIIGLISYKLYNFLSDNYKKFLSAHVNSTIANEIIQTLPQEAQKENLEQSLAALVALEQQQQNPSSATTSNSRNNVTTRERTTPPINQNRVHSSAKRSSSNQITDRLHRIYQTQIGRTVNARPRRAANISRKTLRRELHLLDQLKGLLDEQRQEAQEGPLSAERINEQAAGWIHILSTMIGYPQSAVPVITPTDENHGAIHGDRTAREEDGLSHAETSGAEAVRRRRDQGSENDEKKPSKHHKEPK